MEWLLAGSTTLTIEQIPSHRHKAVLDGYPVVDTAYPEVDGWQSFHRFAANDNGAQIATDYTGGGKGHTHSLPFTSVAVWKRTA